MNTIADETKSTHETNPPTSASNQVSNLTRREFIKIAATTTAAVVLAACAPTVPSAPAQAPTTAKTPGAPAVLKGTTLNMLQWSHFVPEGDKYFDAKAAEWGQ